MALTARQTDLWRDRPPTAADYRAAAEAALQNPYEPPERCQQRAAHYIALAEHLESTAAAAARGASLSATEHP